MNGLNGLIIFGWGAVSSVWHGLLYFQGRMKRKGMMLEPEAYQAGSPTPSVTVIIPACNEEDTIHRCIESVQQQDYPALKILVVDDRSTDLTYELVKQIALTDERIEVMQINELPEGWLGKSHAMWAGSQQVDTDWVLFIDSDCTLHPSAVNTTLGKAQAEQSDLLTLWPSNKAEAFWEHMLIPLCGGIIALWFSNSTTTSQGNTFVNGQFLLIKHDAYKQVGGHQSVKMALIEDIPFAEHASQSGLTATIVGGKDLAGVRMYDSLESIRLGWARIYVGALRSGVKMLLSVLWLLIGSLLPYVVVVGLGANALITGKVPTFSFESTWWLAMLMGFQHLVIMMVVSYRFWGMGNCRRVYLWLYPVSVVMVCGILLQALWWLVVRRRVQWRTTQYAIDVKGQIIQSSTTT